MQVELLKKLLMVHSTMRHDFLNELQVIGGYLQLGNLSRARKYCQRACQTVQNYNLLSVLPSPYLQAFFLWLKSEWQLSEQFFHFVKEITWTYWEEFQEETAVCLLSIFSQITKSHVFQIEAVQQGKGLKLTFSGDKLVSPKVDTVNVEIKTVSSQEFIIYLK